MKMSMFRLTFAPVALLLLVLSGIAQADERGEGPLNPAPPVGITPEQIIQKFAAKEEQFKKAREQYTWRQDVTVETLDGNTVDGVYRQVTDVLFDDQGRRVERVVYAPQSTLQRISLTREDMDDIEHRLPFVLTTKEIPEYDILYVGQQREDELHTYVFDVAPKKIEKNKRYFQGRIWVDDRDFQIVKTHGKNVPDIIKKNNENLFPPFTTWRQQVDSQDGRGILYWFPTYTLTDATLHFSTGDVHIRQIVKYENYKRYGSSVKITYEGQDIGTPDNQKTQPPQQGNPPPPNK
jgi:outer membrane lipoprotein-sorting protein